MECLQEKKKKGSILKKTWERCKSFNHGQPQTCSLLITPLRRRPMVKSKSWSTFFPTSPLSPRVEKLVGSNKNNSRVGLISPKGCLSVYVGPDKQRFVLKIECTNHPLFRMLLEEAESVYGFQSDGPLLLPCEVHIFLKILYEMDGNDDYDDQTNTNSRCGFPRNRSSYHLLNPSDRLIS
ncbi:auxin-responsive protein SAUR40-like [Amaranthus tricolor]|uniref:auxin-responsive protein SAUR40-like n=1 Tax=Amaranthus tricolor TaxID=29722 RepID=UPI00258CCE96|nr:auxin-responsive protein SAUR40-like [Amaranthus tricolor]